MIPQLIYLAITVLSLGITMGKHGEPKLGKHDGWSHVIAVILMQLLLIWGGWYK